ncbi:MAG: PSD1 and planctomycete cytochrome C domain-containing protein, partial [Gemmataceae bacterium]
MTLTALVLALAPAAAPVPTDGEGLFARRVLPVLTAKCFACHGDDRKKRRGGLDLTTLAGMRAGGDSGKPALVPGRPDASPLVVSVTRKDPGLVMPPKDSDRLTDDDVAAVRAWVAAGAPWPTAARLAELSRRPGDGVRVATSGGLSAAWTDRTYRPEDLWAYRPLTRPAVPAGGASPIDAFLAASMRLEPAPEADRRTLIRRVTFDLTGLPPTPEGVDAFLADRRPDAWERLVDRLLASPAHGEQWGRHWLDVARYADSSGLANDFERGSAWRYRDYVVRAFNADKRYDAFVREQIAGDEVAPEYPEALVAVGFLRMGPWELTGMEVAKVARQRYLDDVTDAVGQAFLAHPLQCARCHDHKFDPVPTRDYYRLQAAFATTQLAERPAPFLPAENTAGFGERKYLEARRAEYQKVLKGLDARQEAAGRKWCAERGLPYVARARGLRTGVPERELPPVGVGLDPGGLGMQRIARKGLERLGWEEDRYAPFALSVYSGPTPDRRAVLAPQRPPAALAGTADVTHVLTGGDPFAPADRVAPGVLSAVTPAATLSDGLTGRRRALAEWIARADHPLTARVMVNRLWQHHFGRPIAGNPNNFGATGKKPTHPEMLDWLASEFVASGWSVKHVHRLILGTAAYRRSSRHPDARAAGQYAAFAPRRLAAEELRDAMLAASGELSREVGGVPVRPEIHPEAGMQPRQVMGTFAPAWQPSPLPAQRHRRALYGLRLQGLRDPFFEAFDRPPPDRSAECREASTV